MTKRFLLLVCWLAAIYNWLSFARIFPDFFTGRPSSLDPWNIFWNIVLAAVFTTSALTIQWEFDRYFHIDPRSEFRVAWWMIAIVTIAATAAAILLTVWEPAYAMALNIGYWWPVYGVGLFGLWATTVHLRHWRNA